MRVLTALNPPWKTQMPSCRVPSLLAVAFIDPGTMIRSLSEVPVVIGVSLDQAEDLISRKLRWANDAEAMYIGVVKQFFATTLDASMAATGAVVDGTDPHMAMAVEWDKGVDKMAAEHAAFSRKHRTGASIFNYPARWASEWTHPGDAVLASLLDHYIWRQGQPYGMSTAQMKVTITHLDLFDVRGNGYSPSMQAFIDEALSQGMAKVHTKVSGQNNALGNFPIEIDGVIRRSSVSSGAPKHSAYYGAKVPCQETAEPLVFEGNMRWFDTPWDFDSKMAPLLASIKGIAGSSGRPGGAEITVEAVAALVDGVPFNVESETIPLKQDSGHRPEF
jgi:hypothetical protein